jgi:hypothetical protein
MHLAWPATAVPGCILYDMTGSISVAKEQKSCVRLI